MTCFSSHTPDNIFKSRWLVLALLFVSLSSLAQIRQTKRFEIEHKSSDEYFSIISLKQEGVALLRQKNKYNGPQRIWELILLDTALQKKNTVEMEIHHRHQLVGFEHSPNRLFLLYRTGETTRNSLSLIQLDIASGTELSRAEIDPELDFKLTHFTKVGAHMIFGGYVSNEPAVLLYDMKDNQIKVLPGFFQKDNELVDLRVNENGTFNAVLLDRSLRAERKLVFRTFDETGKLLLEDVVPIEEDRTLQTSISTTLKREDLIIAGTWGERQGKQSSGFFSLAVDPFAEQKINYFPFGELEHFTDYFSTKRAQRIKENAREDALKGKEPSFSAYVLPFRIEEHPEGYMLLAEVYHPTSTANPYYNSPYSNPYYYSPYAFYNPYWPGYYPGMRMYRPYSYGNDTRNHADVKIYSGTVIALDSQGKRIWDHSIKLDDIKKPALEQVCDFYFDASKLYFVYKKESELNFKIIDNRDGAAEEKTEKIITSDPADEIRSDRQFEDGVRHWIGNTFYVWGYQTIRNANNRENRVRDVFYLNKVVVE